jgi:signal transduction histidine kinase
MPAGKMRLSIRYQIVLLVSALVLVAMSIYLGLANNLLISDKLAYLYDTNTQLATTLAEEVHAGLDSYVDRLLYFGAEQAEQAIQPGVEPDRPARALFADDRYLLGVEVWEKSGDTFTRTYHYEYTDRLASLNVDEADLDAARQRYPVDVDRVLAEQVLLINASVAPDLALLRLQVLSHDATRIVVAEIRPEQILRSFSRGKLSGAYLVGGRGEVLVHSDQALVLNHASRAETPVVKAALEGPVDQRAREFEAPGGTIVGTHAAVGRGRLFVVSEVPRAEATKAMEDLQRRSALFAVAVMAAALFLSIVFSRRLAAPLRSLQEKMESISRGDLGVEVEVTSGNEIGVLAAAFNRMSRELRAREAALMEANQQLIQSEKLSALGEMSAGLAHEVKNPMVGICGFSELGAHVETLEEAREYFALINADALRANEILQNLLSFARPERVEFTQLDVNEEVKGAVRLVAHQVQIGGVKLQTQLAEGLPPILGGPNQLRQVLINLMMNGAHAMEGLAERILTVATSLGADGRVVIEVRDTGKGMSEEVQKKLFRPFFTTKPKGKGTGLGLSVSRSIVQQHRGEITVSSTLGKGSVFTIRLPQAVPEQRRPATPAPAA